MRIYLDRIKIQIHDINIEERYQSCDLATLVLHVNLSSTDHIPPSKFDVDWQLKPADDNHVAEGHAAAYTAHMREIHFCVRCQVYTHGTHTLK